MGEASDGTINGFEREVSLKVAFQEEAEDEAVSELSNDTSLIGGAAVAQSFECIVCSDIFVNSPLHHGHEVGDIDRGINILEHGLLGAARKGFQFETSLQELELLLNGPALKVEFTRILAGEKLLV